MTKINKILRATKCVAGELACFQEKLSKTTNQINHPEKTVKFPKSRKQEQDWQTVQLGVKVTDRNFITNNILAVLFVIKKNTIVIQKLRLYAVVSKQ